MTLQGPTDRSDLCRSLSNTANTWPQKILGSTISKPIFQIVKPKVLQTKTTQQVSERWGWAAQIQPSGPQPLSHLQHKHQTPQQSFRTLEGGYLLSCCWENLGSPAVPSSCFWSGSCSPAAAAQYLTKCRAWPLPFASLLGLLAEYTEQGKHAPGRSPPLPCLLRGNASLPGSRCLSSQ